MSFAPSAVPLDAASSLRFHRSTVCAVESIAGSLGGRLVGNMPGALDAALLSPEGPPVLDSWIGADEVQTGTSGSVRYATDGQWLHGAIEIDESTVGLQAAAYCAYADLFEVLATHECPHLIRVWNYLADITGEADGTERYRQFNAGRQQAFIDARRSAFEGAPAACALGMREGPLRISFLAGRTAPIPIENPRQVSAYRYPDAYGVRSPTFSRAALVNVGDGCQALFISGTASIVGHATVHVGDVRRQTEESLRNIGVLLTSASDLAGAVFAAHAMTYTVYVRHAHDLGPVKQAFEDVLGASHAAVRDAIYLQADICRADLLVEIEAHGFASGEGLS